LSLPKVIVIKESEKEIKHLLKVSTPFIAQRLRVLLILKQNESTGISKCEASSLAGVCPGSIQKTAYTLHESRNRGYNETQ